MSKLFEPMSVPVTPLMRHFGPHVAAAGLVVWGYDFPARLWVGTLPDERHRFLQAGVDPAWAWGLESEAFKMLARKLQQHRDATDS